MENQQLANIWTIGHSTRTWEEFIALLSANEIGVLADVRRFPTSRKYPQFNQDELRWRLAAVGIEYAYLPELGSGRARTRRIPFGATRHFAATRITWRRMIFASGSSACCKSRAGNARR
jgi:uncharacterized protein (DUF488 family)